MYSHPDSPNSNSQVVLFEVSLIGPKQELSCWAGERWLTTLVHDLGLILSTCVVSFNCLILNSSARDQLLLLASMGTRHAHAVHLHMFRQNTLIQNKI